MLTVILKLMYNQPIPYIFPLGFQSLRVKVTNDWIKNKVAKIFLTERAIALEDCHQAF
jgi:hypothetical protein